MSFFAQFGKGSDSRMLLRDALTTPTDGASEREIQVGGARILVRHRTSDTHIVDEIFRRTVYGDPPKGIVIDLGANIGAYALYAARTATRVFAFEPEESNFAQLEKNIALNRALPISAFKKAVGGEGGPGTLFVTAVNKGAASLIFDRGGVRQPVDIITLDHAFSLCGVTHVDMLKIDIEGSEYTLLEHASTHTLRRISSLVMEIHRVRGKRLSSLTSKLREAGFHIRMRRTRLWPLGMRILFATRPT